MKSCTKQLRVIAIPSTRADLNIMHPEIPVGTMGHCDVTIAIGSGWLMFVNIQMIIPALCQSDCQTPGARLTKAYDVTIPRYRNSHSKNENRKMHILRRMGSKFCVKFQRSPLKFHTKF